MKKKLSDMTLKELWDLFPIFLTEHNDSWNDWYKEEANFLQNLLHNISGMKINHIGSTAIPNIWAKPIIDILVEISTDYNLQSIKEQLVNNGYICMSQGEDRMSFNKGYTENGFAQKVYHLHLRYAGDNDELYFKDYLLEHLDVAKEYEKLKLDMWKKYEHNRDTYTDAKTEFVSKYTQKAKKTYDEKYV